MEGGAAPLPAVADVWLTDAALDDVMRRYDKDGDGTLTFDEFSSLVRRRAAARRRAAPAAFLG